jgi:hypothetical protein
MVDRLRNARRAQSTLRQIDRSAGKVTPDDSGDWMMARGRCSVPCCPISSACTVCTTAHRGINVDFPGVRFHQPFGRRETQPGSPRFGGEERREDLLANLEGNAWSVISERHITGSVR